MGYDTRPLLTLEDRKSFYQKALEEDLYLFMEHDYDNEIITLQDTEKGARLKESFKFSELFSS